MEFIVRLNMTMKTCTTSYNKEKNLNLDRDLSLRCPDLYPGSIDSTDLNFSQGTNNKFVFTYQFDV